MKVPTFSVVIPTRNRAGLLRHALATAASQTCPDLEIVVSDNCSADGTAAVAREIDDPRVRYVRSEEPLSNADSWEFAVSHATGTWVTVLGDDDGLVPSILDRVAPSIEQCRPGVFAWKTAYYVHPDVDPPWPEATERNCLSVHPFTGRTSEVGAPDQLRRFFERREIDPIPGVRDCFVHRSLLDEVRERCGRVFGEPDPNWALAVTVLACTPSYLVLDLPLTVTGCSTVHVGGGFLRNTRAHDVVREFDADDLFTQVPLQSRTCINVVAESLMRAKQRLPAELAAYELDLVRYFVTVRRELSDPRRMPDGGVAISEWREVLRSQPWAVRSGVTQELARHRVLAAARSLARRVPTLRSLRDAVRRRVEQRTEFLVLDGAECGFSDLPGAARHLDERLLSPVGTAVFRGAS